MGTVYLEYLGNSVELPLGETVVGRDIGCALRFNDLAVSRRHLRFIRRQDEVFLEDLGSANGTLLNGRQVVKEIRIHNGDQVLLGSRALTVRIGDAFGEVPSTLLLGAQASDKVHSRGGDPTSRIAITQPPPRRANQRCPQCGAAVSSDDDECAACTYSWGSFRPSNVTDVKPNPLAKTTPAPKLLPLTKRRHERHSVELHLVYVSSELEIEAMTHDLSHGGVFVCTQVLEPVGTECTLTILVDGGPPLRIEGIVRRVVEHNTEGHQVGLGIEFVRIAVTALSWLEAAVARIAEEARGEDTEAEGSEA